jgi:hypothetical protein
LQGEAVMPAYKVHLRDTVSGATRVVDEDGSPSETDPHGTYLWEEGNWSCDCNRSLWLYDWAPEYKLDCLSEVIVIDGIYLLDGRKVYSETDPR